mmetsp:Transcript_17197/g.2839  ORF Transcript_17197/g.2839 Transcript_17197/m.2839 type:complete len:83 (+) Transcript_17197:3-251(+)
MASKISVMAATALMTNSCLGAGFLTIPWVFLQLGTILSIGGIILFVLISLILSFYILELCCRAEAATQYQEDGNKLVDVSFS